MENFIKQNDWVKVYTEVAPPMIVKIQTMPDVVCRFFSCIDNKGVPVIIMNFEFMHKVNVKQLPDGTYTEDEGLFEIPI